MMKNLFIQAICIFVSVTHALACGGHNHVAVPIDATYSLIFDDEFNGGTLDLTKWTPNWFGSSNTAITAPMDPSSMTAAFDPAQAVVSSGQLCLNLIANPITIGGTTYPNRSGMVSSNGKFEFTYGYAEARIYFPGASSQIANWPAWWTDGHNWPTTGEIDIAEGLSGVVSASFHNAANPNGITTAVSANYRDGWHVYGMLWTSSSITYYYDGVQVAQITSGVTTAPMYLVFDYKTGTFGGPASVPATMSVDYVHVYQQGGTAVTPQANYGGPGDAGP